MEALPPQPKYDAFVSFNKADKLFAERLVKKIESGKVDGRKMKCFFSEWDIQPGEDMLLKIEEAIPQSRFVVIIMSPDWVKSNWTTLERVISVYEDPAGIKGRVIPILRRACEVPLSLRILKWIDISSDSAFPRQAKVLALRLKNQSPRRQEAEPLSEPRTPAHALDTTSASPQEETLASNLFPLVQLPGVVFSAGARVARRNEIWPIVGEGAILPPFTFNEDEGRLYSFSSLTDLPNFDKVVDDAGSSPMSTRAFFSGNLSRTLIDLLNRSMTSHMKGLGMTYDWNTQKTFFPLSNPSDSVRYAIWRVGKRNWQRIVVIKSKSGTYFAHRHCKATFALIGETLFLRLFPGWHFTSDGIGKPVDDATMASLSSRWMNMERNHTLLDNVRFWANVLSQDADVINLEVGSATKAKIMSRPQFATIDRGIEGDYRERLWFTEPGIDEATEGVEGEGNSGPQDGGRTTQ